MCRYVLWWNPADGCSGGGRAGGRGRESGRGGGVMEQSVLLPCAGAHCVTRLSVACCYERSAKMGSRCIMHRASP